MRHKFLWLKACIICMVWVCCAQLAYGQAGNTGRTITARVGRDNIGEIATNLRAGSTLQLEYEEGDVLTEALYILQPVTVKGMGKTGPALRCGDAVGGEFPMLIDLEGDVILEDLNLESCIDGIYAVKPNDSPTPHHLQIINSRFAKHVRTTITVVAQSGPLHVTVDSCDFEDNGDTFSSSSAPVVKGSEQHRISILNSRFLRNSGQSSGVVNVTTDMEGIRTLQERTLAAEEAASLLVRNCTFEDNSMGVVDNGQDPEEIVPAGGAIYAKNLMKIDIEDSRFQRNKVAGGRSEGGAVSIDTCRTLHIKNGSFDENSAEHRGAALSMTSVLYTVIEGVDFLENSCQVPENGTAKCRGGGLYWVDHGLLPATDLGGLTLNSAMTIRSSTFTRNNADEGGAGAIISRNLNGLSSGNFHIVTSNLTENVARQAGGGILARTDSAFRFGTSRFVRNKADRGGALAAFLSGTTHMQDLFFIGNEAASSGGAMFSSSLKFLSVINCLFRDSKAQRSNGGAVMLDGIQSSTFRGARFINNIAQHGIGGGIHFEARSLISNELVVTDSVFNENKAKRKGKPVVLDSMAGGGGAFAIAGQENPDMGSLNVEIKHTSFNGNGALGGGALLIMTAKPSSYRALDVQLLNNTFADNYAFEAGGILLLDKQDGISIKCERRREAGRSPVEVFNGEPCPNWTPIPLNSTSKEDLEVYAEVDFGDPAATTGKHNRGKIAPFGNVFASFVLTTLEVAPNKTASNLSGQEVERISVIPFDVFGQEMTTEVLGQIIKVEPSTVSGLSFGGQTIVHVENGRAIFAALSFFAAPKNFSINLTGRIPGRAFFGEGTARFDVEIRECVPGEIIQENILFGCAACAGGLFSFDPKNKTCDSCPSQANCTGSVSKKGQVVRHSLVPLDGYWHSTPFSPQMQKCLSDEACKYEGRNQVLQSFVNPYPTPSNRSMNQSVYQQCRAGHHGILCGACDADYGHTGVGECTKCRDSWVYVLTLIGSMLVSLVLVMTTLRGNLLSEHQESDLYDSGSYYTDGDAWSAIIEMQPQNGSLVKKMPSNSEENLQTVANGIKAGEAEEQAETPEKEPEGEDENNKENDMGPKIGNEIQEEVREKDKEVGEGMLPTEAAVAAATAANATTVESPGQSTSGGLRPILESDDGSSESDEANSEPKMKITELIKIMINFTQVTGTAFLIDFKWPDSIKNMVGIQEVFSAASGFWGATECVLPSSSRVTKAMSSLVLNIATPIMFALFLTIFWVVRAIFLDRHASVVTFKKYLIPRMLVTAWSIVFYYYDSWTESFMKLVYCPSVDQVSQSDAYYEFAIAKNRVWAQDTDIVCFKGVHKVLFYGVGVPGLVLFTLGIPIALFTFIMVNFSRLESPRFRAFFGFMYVNYDLEYAYWESAIMVRKALIVAIAVLAHSLGKSLQGLFMLGVIVLAMVTHTITRPLPLDMLDNMETWSLVTTAYTFFSAVVFSDPETSNLIRLILSISLYLVNVCFLLHFTYGFIHALREFVIGYKHGDDVARQLGPHVGFHHRVYYLITAEYRNLLRRVRRMFRKKKKRKGSHHPGHTTKSNQV